MNLRLVADDLTGALDAAAPFAHINAPVGVFRDAHDVKNCSGNWALDAATRGRDATFARAAAERAGHLLRGAGIAFRKIDSRLRGHVVDEIAVTARAGGFASVVVAPAFPSQARITRGGKQFTKSEAGDYEPCAVDLAVALGDFNPSLVRDARMLRGEGAFLCDAETDAELSRIAAARDALTPETLWCGTAGLAHALAGNVQRLAVPAGPLLGVIGSRHPVILAELRQVGGGRLIEVGSLGAVPAAVAQAARQVESGISAVLLMRLVPSPPDEAELVLRALADAATRLRPRALFASGGDTLAALIEASGAERLDVLGEIAPGMPLSRAIGGIWNGMPILSKSGGFAGGAALQSLFGDVQVVHGQA